MTNRAQSYQASSLEIYEWLCRHQITEPEIEAKVKNNFLYFKFDHPIGGMISAKREIPIEKIWQESGITFQTISQKGKNLRIRVYDYGGILDPIDGFVPGEHYGTTFFAYLSALFFKQTGEAGFLSRAKMAGDFHISTSPDEYHKDPSDYHWAFNNLGFIESYRLISSRLDPQESLRWKQAILTWKDSYKHFVTNWQAMRAYNHLLRYKLFRKGADKLLYIYFMTFVRIAQKKDGCIDDIKNASRALQYHVYTLALLHRIYLLSKKAYIRMMIIRGLEYLLPFIDPEGEFNYRGRGQRQIFGYAALLYVLEASKRLNPARANVYQYYLDLVWKYLYGFQCKQGYFPLVLSRTNDLKQAGWYVYHHLTVYNAITAVWLYLAGDISSELQANKPAKNTITYYQPTRTVIAGMENYHAVVSGGEKKYLSDAGLTFQHLWIREMGILFSCPGGPYGEFLGPTTKKDDVLRNFFAPIALFRGHWFTPAFRNGKLKRVDQSHFMAELDYGPFTVKRRLFFASSNIEVSDEIKFSKRMNYDEFRVFNLPFPKGKFPVLNNGAQLEMKSSNNPANKVTITFFEDRETAVSLDEEIIGPCGVMVLCSKKYFDLHVIPGSVHKLRFLLEFHISKVENY